jgi:hypothetical protein
LPKRRKHELVTAKHFLWLVGKRSANGVFYADGRSNARDCGRHSLGTRDYLEAVIAVHKLDVVIAVRQGIAEASSIAPEQPDELDVKQGIQLYMAHVRRPRVLRGATPKTAQRYTAVFDKFEPFLKRATISNWQKVTKSTLQAYSQWLVDENYADATIYLELTTLKQAIKWLATEQHLKQSHAISLPLRPPVGTTTYCYTDQQVAAMLARCADIAELGWLGRIIRGLCHTGLRISELAQLRWSAIDINAGMLRVVDNSRESPRRGFIKSRTKPLGARTVGCFGLTAEGQFGPTRSGLP